MAQAGAETVAIRHKAERQATDLLNAIERNPRIRDLATNPLMLTVISLVHRYRATLPQRRVELYEECTELLLGHWDMGKEGEEAKWLAEYAGIEIQLDASEKRTLLEPVARWYHEHRVTMAEQWQVEQLLAERMAQVTLPAAAVGQSQARSQAKDFLVFLDERSGLFQEWEVGQYAFTHLTFQEYLTARDIASEDDYVQQIISPHGSELVEGDDPADGGASEPDEPHACLATGAGVAGRRREAQNRLVALGDAGRRVPGRHRSVPHRSRTMGRRDQRAGMDCRTSGRADRRPLLGSQGAR